MSERSPSQRKMYEIAYKTGLSYYQVYKWFWEQNRKVEKTLKAHPIEYLAKGFGKKTRKKKLLKKDQEEFQIFACIEIILPAEDPMSEEAAEHIR